MLHIHTILILSLLVKREIVREEYPAKTGCLPLFAAQKTLARLLAVPATFGQLSWKTCLESFAMKQRFRVIAEKTSVSYPAFSQGFSLFSYVFLAYPYDIFLYPQESCFILDMFFSYHRIS